MAIPLGKLTILVGAGIVGSIIAKESCMSNVSDIVSGAFKLVFRQLKHDDSTQIVNKPQNVDLMAQVNNLRQELQIYASNRPITIVTRRGIGTSKYSIIVVVVVVGYGYVWWKGWKLPDMMFATRRSLSDARDAIAKQLEGVYSSISTTRRHLSSRIDGVDNRLEEIADITATTQDDVSLLQDKSKAFNSNVQYVRDAVQTLESKINRIEGKQEITTKGVDFLCNYAQTVEQNGSTDRIQALPASSSVPALKAPNRTPPRTGSLPPNLPVELPSPSHSNGAYEVRKSPRNAVSTSGLKEVGESSNHVFANGNRTSEDRTNGSSSSGIFGAMFPGRGASFLTRTHSATNAVPEMRSNRQYL